MTYTALLWVALKEGPIEVFRFTTLTAAREAAFILNQGHRYRAVFATRR